MHGQIYLGLRDPPSFLDIGKRVFLCGFSIHWQPASMPTASQRHDRRVVAQLEVCGRKRRACDETRSKVSQAK